MKAKVLVKKSKPVIESVHALSASHGLIGSRSREWGEWVLVVAKSEPGVKHVGV